MSLVQDPKLLKDQKDGFDNIKEEDRKFYNFLMDKNLVTMTNTVKRCYADQELMRDYQALRSIYSHDDWKNKSNAREVYRPPHPFVHRFIDAEMTKKYGPHWMKDKDTFRKVCKKEDLIKPWLLVPWNKL